MRNFFDTLLCSYILILLGAYLLIAAGYDEYRGITYKPIPLLPGAGMTRRGMGHAYLYRIPVRREQNPELFRNFMTGHWIWAVGFESLGWVLYWRNKV